MLGAEPHSIREAWESVPQFRRSGIITCRNRTRRPVLASAVGATASMCWSSRPTCRCGGATTLPWLAWTGPRFWFQVAFLLHLPLLPHAPRHQQSSGHRIRQPRPATSSRPQDFRVLYVFVAMEKAQAGSLTSTSQLIPRRTGQLSWFVEVRTLEASQNAIPGAPGEYILRTVNREHST